MNSNPFEYGAAIDLSEDDILDYYIEDFNYSRFIQSRRNVFLLGERGSGKTMTLLYNSFPVRLRQWKRSKASPSYDWIGVYVPCNTPLTHKVEYELLDKLRAEIISEHYLVLGIVHAIAESLSDAPQLVDSQTSEILQSQLEFILGQSLPTSDSLFLSLQMLVEHLIVKTQKSINLVDSGNFYEDAATFSTFILPILNSLRRVPALRKSHFMLMLDDAHDLNPYQTKILNSWIAYRDHSLFSFKVATAKVERPPQYTASGGAILEGHDYTGIDLEKPLHYGSSDFGNLAHLIVQRRLERLGLSESPDDFFPTSPQVEQAANEARERVRKIALEKHPNGSQKQINDYIYKHYRAEMFRRPAKANLPVYSGFQSIVYISTGVVRNLLEPCFRMYDATKSQLNRDDVVREIPSSVQDMILKEQSQRKWDQLEQGLDKVIFDCTREQAKHIYNLFDQLAILFRERLNSDISEPRANSFTVSGFGDEEKMFLLPLLNIARRARFLYTRIGPAKDDGARETYYVPNRILWPIRGLDPQGQHARVSLKASDLIGACSGKKLPFSRSISAETLSKQESLFDE